MILTMIWIWIHSSQIQASSDFEQTLGAKLSLKCGPFQRNQYETQQQQQ